MANVNEFERFIKFYEDHVYNKKQNTYFTAQQENTKILLKIL